MPSSKRRAGRSPDRSDGAEAAPVIAPAMTAFAAAAQQRAQDSDPRYESDDDDYEETDEPSVASPTASFCAPLTTWTESSTNVSSATPERLTIVLKKHEIVVQIGVYDLYVEEGAIAINGALIRAKHQPLRIFAPATHSLPAVEALSHAVVRFTSCSSFSMQTLERLSPLYAKIWNAKKEEPYQRSFAMVYLHENDEYSRPLVPMEGSDQASAAGLYAGESPAIVISGAKLSGKNRFANFLMNQMSIMKKGVATFYLDLDVEKPEYTPQGQISLVRVRKLNMGPPYTHPIPIPGDENDNEIVWSHPMPLKGAAEYAEYYRSCIVDLIGRYNAIRSVHPKIALVINTPAFDIANGALSFLDTIGDINPTRLLYLGAPIRRKDACSISRIDRYCRKRGIYFETRAQDIKAVPLRSDNTLKELHMLSYFHCQGIEAASGERTYNTAPLSCMNPWQVYYGTSKPLDFIGVLVLGDWPGPDTITTILNGALVTIVETTDPATQALYDTLPRTPEDLSIRAHYGPDSNIPALMAGIPYFPPSASVVAPLDPANTRVVCNALIRGFDIDEQCLQILIPPSHDRLLMELDRRKTVLVAGCCEHPGWAYTEDPYVDYKENVHREDTEIRGGAWREGKDGVRLPPWVADAGEVEEWGKMNMVRRTRKFTSGR